MWTHKAKTKGKCSVEDGIDTTAAATTITTGFGASSVPPCRAAVCLLVGTELR